MTLPKLDGSNPVIVAVAGPNGAGKTTFFEAHLARLGLPFVNADRIADHLRLNAYAAAEVAERLRQSLAVDRESFITETVLSDPVGAKVDFLARAHQTGYQVVFCFIGLGDPRTSKQRVAMRVSQSGHDVPDAKLEARFPRTLKNLHRAIAALPLVLVYDNDDLNSPFRLVAQFEHGRRSLTHPPLPAWLTPH